MNSKSAQEGAEHRMTYTNNVNFAEASNQQMEKVVERGNLLKAFKQVESNKGAAGIDKMEVGELRQYLKENWLNIKEELLKGTYKPKPVRRVEIPKQDGGIRELGIPTVLDRFIQQAISQILSPIAEITFSTQSYGFRPGKSARQAVRKAQEYIKSGKRIVVDMDLEKFFDRVNHDLLMTKVSKLISDKRIHKVIRNYLKAGIMLNGCCVTTEEGVPQGGPLSPLLANIMLNDLDHELTQRGHSFVRYADDCNIYVASKRAGERVYESIRKFIEKRLKLKINEKKSAVERPWRRKFLGFSFSNCAKVKLRIAPKTRKRFQGKIRELTKRNLGIAMEKRLKQLNEYLKGWSGYYGIAETRTVFQELDQWIRRRLRACVLKQWRKPRTKLRNLRNLGLRDEWAKSIAYSQKGVWRLSQTQQVCTALGLDHWKDQGLVSLVNRYDVMHQKVFS